MTAPAARLPLDTGVIAWHGEIVVYEMVDAWEFDVREDERGVMRIPIRTGGKAPEARILGSQTLMEITDTLRTAIEADRRTG